MMCMPGYRFSFRFARFEDAEDWGAVLTRCTSLTTVRAAQTARMHTDRAPTTTHTRTHAREMPDNDKDTHPRNPTICLSILTGKAYIPHAFISLFVFINCQ